MGTNAKIIDHVPEILLAGLLSPIVLGLISGILFNDFSLGAGVGIFIMIAAIIISFLSVTFDI